MAAAHDAEQATALQRVQQSLSRETVGGWRGYQGGAVDQVCLCLCRQLACCGSDMGHCAAPNKHFANCPCPLTPLHPVPKAVALFLHAAPHRIGVVALKAAPHPPSTSIP